MTTNKQKPTPDLSTSEKQNAFLEEYKLYVKMLEYSTQRRTDTTNALFVSTQTVVLAATSLFSKGNGIPLLMVAIIGIIISIYWRALLINYNTINALKWEVVYDMEQFLPYKPFYGEWHDKLGKTDAEEWRKGNYSSLTLRHYASIGKLEKALPMIFIGIYILMGVYGLYCLTGGANTADLAESVAKVQEAVSDLEAALAEITRSTLAN